MASDTAAIAAATRCVKTPMTPSFSKTAFGSDRRVGLSAGTCGGGPAAADARAAAAANPDDRLVSFSDGTAAAAADARAVALNLKLRHLHRDQNVPTR